MNRKRRAKGVAELDQRNVSAPVTATPCSNAAITKESNLSLILSIVALIVSILSVVFTAFDFLGSRAVVLYMEPKEDASISDPKAPYILRSAANDISILRVHAHFLAYPKSGTINLQLLGPNIELTSEPFQQLGQALASAGKHANQTGDSCVGTIPLLVEVKYVAKGRVHDSAAFYHLAFDYFNPTLQHPAPSGYVLLRHLEFSKSLWPWQSPKGQTLQAQPCDWTDTSDESNKRDWTFVR